MANIDTTQAGPFHLGTTWVGGSVPTGTDTAKLKHDVTLEQDLDEASLAIEVKTATFDTRNAAGTTNYDLTCKSIFMWYSDSVMNFRDGDHTIGTTGSSFTSYNTDSHTHLGGCTLTMGSWGSLFGKCTTTGENTMIWGGRDMTPYHSSFLRGRGEGNFNDGSGWEDASSRIHFVYSQAENTGSLNYNTLCNVEDTPNDVDADAGPYVWKMASLELKNRNYNRRFFFDFDEDQSEWSYNNSVIIDIGAGEHGFTNEGRLKVWTGSYYQQDYSTDAISVGFRVRGDMLLTDDSGLGSPNWYCGYTVANGRCGFMRIDGDLTLDGGSLGSTNARMYIPLATPFDTQAKHWPTYSITTDTDDLLLGGLYIFGTLTNEGRFDCYGSSGLTATGTATFVNSVGGTYNVFGGFDATGYSGSGTNELSGVTTLSHIREFALSDMHPSGASLGTKPKSTDNLRIKDFGNDPGHNFKVDENLSVVDVTIDANATLTIDSGITLTYSGDFTNNGTLTNNGTMTFDPGETKKHASFGRGGRGGKTSFSGDAANDLDQANWVENYFLDQDNRLG